jgi:alpha-tubulin suppressor-like RCC1 family protein
MLKADNTVGYTESGQLGIINRGVIDNPFKIAKNVMQIACGNLHTVILKTNGEVYGTGSNRYSQIHQMFAGLSKYIAAKTILFYLKKMEKYGEAE